MKDKIMLLKHQIAYDIQYGIVLQYKKFLFFMLIIVCLFLLFNRRVSECPLISEDSIAGFWDYLIYLFRGKEEIRSPNQLDIFNIPIEWLLIHSYFFFTIGTFPKEEYVERGYQFLLRTGNKWHWWFSKVVYMILTVFLYFIGIAVVAFGFSMVGGANIHDVNKEICYHVVGIDVSEIGTSDIILGTFIMPLIVVITLCIAEMLISFLVSSVVAVIVLLGYLSASAYWCNEWLLGNYTMLVRTHKVSFLVGIVISCGSIVIFNILGYFYFKGLDVLGKQREEI